MFLEPCCLIFQVTNAGSRASIREYMGERYCQTKEYATDDDRTDDIGCVCEVVVSQYWDAGCSDTSGEQPNIK